MMATFDVADLSALEILDSRGRPTLAVTVRLADGTAARAGVPSGASTGSREAVERRDGDPDRYEGKGVLGAVAAVNTEIRDLLRGRSWGSLAEADQAMIDLDGTANKSRLGANATVGTSMALARALAATAGIPLWQWITPDGVPPSLPVPHFNVLNGGVHAPNSLDFQEFMIAPVGASSMAEAVRAGAEVYAALRRELTERKLSTGLGDEGGFAPEISEPEEVLRLLAGAIGRAGYQAGRDGVSIALDLARRLNAEARELANAGAGLLQIDEPFLAGYPDQVELAIEAVNIVTEGVNATCALHVCYGNRYARPSWEGHYDFLFPAVKAARVDQVVLEFARKGLDDLRLIRQHGWDKWLGLGVIDVKNPEVEAAELVASRIRRALDYVPAERLMINPDCGLRHLAPDVARQKLRAMVAGVALVRAELPGGETS
jgi:hypothetical protein